MCPPKNENERGTEGQPAKNTESADTLKRKLSELYAEEGCQYGENGQPEDTSHLVSSGSAGKKRETATEKRNPEEVREKENAHEKKEDNEVDQNGQTSTSKTNTKKHRSSTDEPPNRRKKKKRKKKFNDNGEVTKPSKQMIRINYLLQASFLMNELNPNISREYIKTMRKLSNKFLIKHDKKFKKLFCKKCNSVLIPSATCKVSVNPLNLRKKKKNKNEEVSSNLNGKLRDEFLVSYRCNYCHHDTKFVYENGLTAPRANGTEAV
ncbi:ribonuclease P protein subunit RPR2, putative [Plasmodium vivax]|uniref:Ribonuclease P protein subunit RPR2, putative n=1 Tax=Plasmodium vivax TaxID=5855 RepID=A0A1G4H1K6_PLAVI|nr:ribonuclease P protein subunit RPR2, putative [Plasmodium vivax]